SGFPRTYEAYGVSYGESRERFSEVLEVIKRAWTETSFSFQGKYYTFDKVHLVPKPYQKPHPPIRVAATSADTFAGIGALGHPIFVAVRLGTLSELAPSINTYREAYRAAGHPGDGEVFLRVPVYVAKTYERARSDAEESIMSFYRFLGSMLEKSASSAGVRAIEQRAERGQRLQTIQYADALRDKVIVGTPEIVTNRINQLTGELGLSGILAELNCGSLIPHTKVMNSLELLCEKVMPEFKQ
ncbi:MAG TPA: LLM class flavin-dependent oxidoreductase, partial [Candidatus Binataceae bacterium]|nr:LLM class flavin-dependent oxidoreductase [Candidatus Binataceae bacterium]